MDYKPDMNVVRKVGVSCGLLCTKVHDAQQANDIIEEVRHDGMIQGMFNTLLALGYSEATVEVVGSMGKACRDIELEARKEGKGQWLNV